MLRRQGFAAPIVAMTANASDRDRDECLGAGMDGFLSKPVLKNRLAEAIMQVTRQPPCPPVPLCPHPVAPGRHAAQRPVPAYTATADEICVGVGDMVLQKNIDDCCMPLHWPCVSVRRMGLECRI